MGDSDGDGDGTTIFTDTVDGTFSLQSYCIKVIDTPAFQRLRGLSQLGVTKYVFPGAVHSRFEHSLGTARKSYKIARNIFKQQGGERAAAADGVGVDMDEEDVKFVTLAGLTHDLGHGPLSHPFENFLKRLGITHWRHEHMSGRILDYIVTNYDVDITRSDIPRITQLIHGLPPEHRQGAGVGLWRPGRRFLFDIVANKRNGVDVDKVDYLQRDATMCGVKVGCDFDRLLKKRFIKVIDDEVCYHWSEYPNILDLFRAREAMHRKVYTNRKCKAVELMAVDALVAAEPLLRITERLDEPGDFISLDDSLLRTIETYEKNYRSKLNDVEEKALTKAQEIVRLIRTRKLYRFGNQFTVPPEYLADSRWESMKRHFTPAEVASCYGGSDIPGGLQPDDIICDENKIDHTMGGANPAERVGFFRNYSSREKYYIGQHQVVGIMPHLFQERVLRVFTRHQEERYVRAIEEALRNWCDQRFGSAAQLATPVRPRRQQSAGSGAAAPSDVPQLVFTREVLINQLTDGMRPQGPAARVQGGPPMAGAARGGGGCGALGSVSNSMREGSCSHSGGHAATTGTASESTPVRAVLQPAPGRSWVPTDGATATAGGNAAAGGGVGAGSEDRAAAPRGLVGEQESGRVKRQRTSGRHAC
ncbi:hypothetical protein Vretifemale_15033 [Volvox reticuliferus]|uniref:HD/PDEase domain-containing protein n=2 Tax=Volvox reticuliferus TaxID=1737510 RepID=A0A8J4CNL1_9CHLO|nr:hypothetical protein Vretifemale_15033 [Volvox reticuliferus]